MTQRIILADDHPVVVLGANMALSTNPGSPFTVVAQAHGVDELIERLHQCPCDVLITDYCMPHGMRPDGLALIGYIRRHFSQVRLVVMTMLNNPPVLQALLKSGVLGLFDKHQPFTELRQAARSAGKGQHYLSPSFRHLLDNRLLPATPLRAADVATLLSPRELEVVRLFVQGLSGRDIARCLNRSEKTISRQKRTAMDKLGLGHDGALVDYAKGVGLMG